MAGGLVTGSRTVVVLGGGCPLGQLGGALPVS